MCASEAGVNVLAASHSIHAQADQAGERGGGSHEGDLLSKSKGKGARTASFLPSFAVRLSLRISLSRACETSSLRHRHSRTGVERLPWRREAGAAEAEAAKAGGQTRSKGCNLTLSLSTGLRENKCQAIEWLSGAESGRAREKLFLHYPLLPLLPACSSPLTSRTVQSGGARVVRGCRGERESRWDLLLSLHPLAQLSLWSEQATKAGKREKENTDIHAETCVHRVHLLSC